MNHDTGRTLKNPGVSGEVRDVLTEVLRQGAQQLITQAIETEVEEFLRHIARCVTRRADGNSCAMAISRPVRSRRASGPWR